MKKTTFLILILSTLACVGCATATYTFGNDFPSENVAKIENGITTAAQLITMFGQPFSKTVVSKNQESWLYTYASGTSKAQSYIVKIKVQSEGKQKTLNALLQDGVVLNYTFTDGLSPYKMSVN